MGKTSKSRCWAGFDLGGTKMRVLVYDDDFREWGRAEAKTRGFRGARAGVKRMAELLEEALAAARGTCRRAHLAGVGLACPGPVDMARGIVREMPNVGWREVPVARLLRTAAGVPVAVLNDVDAGTYGEYRFGAGRGAHCLVGVFPGTGVGGGCVMDGRILVGARSSCMEIGHLPVQPDGPLCGCGQRGCLEAVTSRLAIASDALVAAYRGEAPHLLAIGGTDLQKIRSKALAGAIAAGDQAVERIVRDAARWLGVGVAAVVNLLAPDRIVLGGGLVEELRDLYLDEVTRTARARVMRTYRDSFRVCAAKLDDTATARGAAAWAAAQATA